MKFCITTTYEFFGKDFCEYEKHLKKYNLTSKATKYFHLDNKTYFKHYIDINTIDELIEIITNIKEQIVIYWDWDYNEFVIEIYNDYIE